jgi:hypothetical protein
MKEIELSEKMIPRKARRGGVEGARGRGYGGVEVCVGGEQHTLCSMKSIKENNRQPMTGNSFTFPDRGLVLHEMACRM